MDEIRIENRIGKHAETLMRFYMTFQAAADGDTWMYRAERQSFIDALQSMVRSGLLADYDVCGHTLTYPDGSTTKL